MIPRHLRPCRCRRPPPRAHQAHRPDHRRCRWVRRPVWSGSMPRTSESARTGCALDGQNAPPSTAVPPPPRPPLQAPPPSPHKVRFARPNIARWRKSTHARTHMVVGLAATGSLGSACRKPHSLSAAARIDTGVAAVGKHGLSRMIGTVRQLGRRERCVANLPGSARCETGEDKIRTHACTHARTEQFMTVRMLQSFQ